MHQGEDQEAGAKPGRQAYRQTDKIGRLDGQEKDRRMTKFTATVTEDNNNNFPYVSPLPRILFPSLPPPYTTYRNTWAAGGTRYRSAGTGRGGRGGPRTACCRGSGTPPQRPAWSSCPPSTRCTADPATRNSPLPHNYLRDFLLSSLTYAITSTS